jgi:AcrR family transcriptional regulator
MDPLSDIDTKSRILDAAERAFADAGFAAASLRHIIAAAKVNLAAVHYHFGSKEGLIEAVFARRIKPLNTERLALLDAAEKRAGSRALPVTGVLAAMIGPALRLSRDETRGGAAFTRLLGRTLAEPTPGLQSMLQRQFGDVIARFTAAFRRALPRLPDGEIFWRIKFVVGAMAHTMCDPQNLRLMSRDLRDPADAGDLTRRLVNFLAAGMRAPPPPKRRTRK